MAEVVMLTIINLFLGYTLFAGVTRHLVLFEMIV